MPEGGDAPPDELVVEARLKIIRHAASKFHPAFVEWRLTAGKPHGEEARAKMRGAHRRRREVTPYP